MADTSLYERLRPIWERDPDRTLLEHPNGRPRTYRWLLERSARAARAIQEEGVPVGGRVAVQADKGEDLLAVYVGCLRAGAALLPLNPAATAEEVAYYLRDSRASLFLCQPERLEQMRAMAERCGVPAVESLAADGESGTFQQRLARTPADPGPVSLRPEATAAILYTSGTTGRPKGAMLTHRNLAANADALHDAWGWTRTDVLVHALPLFHIHGLFVAAGGVLRAGASMIFLPRFDPDAVIHAFRRATIFMGVPTMYHRLAAHPGLTSEACRGMRLFISGSAPLSVADFEAFRARTGHTILERYGMTETGMNLSNPLRGPRKPGSVGLPLAGVQVRLVDPETRRDVPPGEVGEIWLRGPNIFAGYFGAPEKTAEAFHEGWFRTGDLARRDGDGYYAIVGRLKDMVISGGLNVYPAEVEAVLDAIDGVEESAVVGVPDADLGERVAAAIVRCAWAAELTEERVITAARERLAPYKCPRTVRFLEALPRNAMGKVEKTRLREILAGA
ncbi:MAG TPA: AMP-binding protein [bacterium]|nr:AMP-binding protein [bacterium]